MISNCKLPDFINPMAMRTYPARGCRKRPSSLQQKHCRGLGFNNAVMCAFPVDDMSMITSSTHKKSGLAEKLWTNFSRDGKYMIFFETLEKAKSPKFTSMTKTSLLVGRRGKSLGREPKV